MTRQQLIRRIVLGAFTVALALPGFGAAAAEKTDDFGNVDDFESLCIAAGGIFTDTRDGNTWCQHDDDSQTVCDSNGNDCYTIDKQPPTDPGSPFVGSTGEIIEILPMEPAPTVEETLIGGGVVVAEIHINAAAPQTVAPADQPLLAVDDTQTVAPVEQALMAVAEAEVAAPIESQEASAAESGALAAPAEEIYVPAEVAETPAEEPIPAASSEVVEFPVEAPVTLTEEPVAAEASAEQP